MEQDEKARAFATLHISGKPLTLYNIWDAGSAKVVADAGAEAVATGSWSVAAAQGYSDGEAIPLDAVEVTVRRITAIVDVPVTVDLEGAYAVEPGQAAANAVRIVGAGAVGINFEDGVVGGHGLHGTALQCRRIQAIRAAAEALGITLFINARTDLFLRASDAALHADLLAPAIERARAYALAGASGYFVPGLVNERLIGKLCAACPVPVNIMAMQGVPSHAQLANLGVGRISYGPKPYRDCMDAFGRQALEALQPVPHGMT